MFKLRRKKGTGHLRYMMYEDDTPVSPACDTEHELAQWLTDNKVVYLGMFHLNYEGWMDIIKIGYSRGTVFTDVYGPKCATMTRIP